MSFGLTLQARVRARHIALAVPTDLPEGSAIELAILSSWLPAGRSSNGGPAPLPAAASIDAGARPF